MIGNQYFSLMTPERWHRIEEIFHAANSLDTAHRSTFLAESCGTDDDLRRCVERLLAASVAPQLDLDRPAWDQSLTQTISNAAEPVEFGVYRVVSELGRGGMGAVYLAEDTRLGRKVAIKVSQTRYSHRFEREARAIAALNHPNVCTLYDVGPNYLVMEFCAGETLAARLKRGPLTPEETARAGSVIAAALAAAHTRGIIHRDLKPANIILGKSGPKVLDFGLAKSEVDPTLTSADLIMGTPAYMAPEQRKGGPTDHRTDIYALGLVLREMLTGKSDPSDHPALASSELGALIDRCTRADPDERWQSAADVSYQLAWIAEEGRKPQNSGAAPAPERVTGPGAIARRWKYLAAGVAAVVLIVSCAWIVSEPGSTDFSNYHLTPFATEAAEESSPAWSPDGRTLAYEFAVNGVKQIYTRSLDALAASRVTSSDEDCLLPFWSPGGDRIYYISRNKLWSIGPAGGEPRAVIDEVTGAAISPDGKTFAIVRGIPGAMSFWIAPVSGGAPQIYRTPPFSDRLALVSAPQFSPDGSKIAEIASLRAAGADSALWVIPFHNGAAGPKAERLPVHSLGQRARVDRLSWMPDNRTVALGGVGRLYAIDTRSHRMRTLLVNTTGASQPAVSPDGRRLAFAAGDTDIDIVEVTLGNSTPRTFLATAGLEAWPSWSPNGSQYAYIGKSGANYEIWLRDADGENARPVVTPDAAVPWSAVQRVRFSPDGRHLAYDIYGNQHVIGISSIFGGRPVILDTQSPDQHGASWSPDGNWIAYRRLNGNAWELVKRPIGGGDAVRLGPAAGGGSGTDWSPNGEWICQEYRGGLQLVSSDGAKHVSIASPGTGAFAFSRDSATLFAIRLSSGRKWELARFSVPSGAPAGSSPLDLPVGSTVSGMSFKADGKTFITSVGQARLDIWLLDGFNLPRRRFPFGSW
ncbi:MAG TPA: protein kinase [Candidatus Limnocylindrales bacterium]|nr:protein kinase [Candidatus Limnocylindrales bacterium]